LILVARRRERLLRMVEYFDVECVVIDADLSRLSECKRVINEISDYPVEMFINNAGFGDQGYFYKTNLENEFSMIDLNVKAMHYFTKKIIRMYMKSGGGFLLNVASSAGLLPGGPYMATYYATKSYVTSLTMAVADEISNLKGCENIHISCLCPGPVKTEFSKVAKVKFKLPELDAYDVAMCGILEMFNKKTVIVPMWWMKLIVYVSRIVPYKLSLKIAGAQQSKSR